MKKTLVREGDAASRQSPNNERISSTSPGKRPLTARLASVSRKAARTAGSAARASAPAAQAPARSGEPPPSPTNPMLDAALGLWSPASGSDGLPYRDEMEAAFGEDFSGVSVHTGRARDLAAIHARAAASGEHIAFADARPDKHTVAHELAHVAQHRRHGGGSGGLSQPDDAAEHEADRIASAVASGQAAPPVQHPAVTRGEPPAPPAPHAPDTATSTPDIAGNAEHDQPATGAAPAQPATASPDHSGRQPAPRAAQDATHSAAPPPPQQRAHGAAPPPQQRAPAAAATAVSGAPGAAPGESTSAGHELAPAAAIRGTANAFGGLEGTRLSELDAALRGVALDAETAQQAARASAPSAALPPPAPAALAPQPAAQSRPAAPTAPAAAPPQRRPIEHESAPGDQPEHQPEHQAKNQSSPGGSTAPRPRGGISAGPRPQVALAGDANPELATVDELAGQAQLDTRLHAANRHSAADLGVSSLSVPPGPPAPRPPPVTPALEVQVPEIPEAPWAKLEPAARAQLDELVAPALDHRMAELDARVQADSEQSQAQLHQVQARHRARAADESERGRTQMTALRDAGEAQVNTLRGEWQAESQAVRDHTVAQVQAEHVAMEADVQETVRAGELRADAILTSAEHEAGSAQSQAEARAGAIVAAAESRAAAARSRSSGVAAMRSVARQEDSGEGSADSQQDGEDEARRILEQAQGEVEREIALAQRQIEQLIANAGALTEAEIEARILHINARINQLRVSLAVQIDEALGDRFPELESHYLDQISTLLGDIKRNMFIVADTLFAGDAAGAAEQMEQLSAIIDARTERLNMTLEDAAVLSTFDDIGTALDAFGINMVSDATLGDRQNAWNDTQRQQVIAQAIRMENAFRAADQDGLFEVAGLTEPGAAFNAIMAGGDDITLRMANRTSVNSETGETENKSGAITQRSNLIDYYTLSRDQTEWIANARQFHFGHEFGHAFNATMIAAANGLEDRDPSAAPYTNGAEGLLDTQTIHDPDGNPIVGSGVDRFMPNDAVVAELRAQYPDTWQQELQAMSEAQGLRSGTMSADSSYGYLRMMPYQQNGTNASGEWFADMYVNWANGTLPDNGAGLAVDEWMDEQMQEWIRMRLDANGQLPDPPQHQSDRERLIR